jgi:hypothetical protein
MLRRGDVFIPATSPFPAWNNAQQDNLNDLLFQFWDCNAVVCAFLLHNSGTKLALIA